MTVWWTPPIPGPWGSAGPPAAWGCSFWDVSSSREGFPPTVPLCPQVPGAGGQELAVHPGDSDGTEEGG